MTGKRAMEFITLTTGAVAMSPRSDVDPDVLRKIKAALRTGDGVLWAGWSVRPLACPYDGTVWDMLCDGVAVSRCWLAGQGTASDDLWEMAEQAAPPQVVLHRPRGVPWLAVAILPDAIPLLEAQPLRLMEVADAERCVAWAILTMGDR